MEFSDNYFDAVVDKATMDGILVLTLIELVSSIQISVEKVQHQM
jgi:hypothetical protein